jgi:hypothetical protein
MKVIDNFLPSYQFKQLQSHLMGDEIPWFYKDEICEPGDGFYQFCCGFNFDFPLIQPCLSLLGVNKLFRLKANLNPRTVFHRNGGYHTDGYPHITTSILYINTCNGYTKVKGCGRVDCRENRIVIFDSDIEHAGFTCTDEKRKIVINFNWK